MATGQTHDEHIAAITGLSDSGKTAALQKAVYLTVDATDSTRDSDKVQEALDYLKEHYGLDTNITAAQIVSPNAEHQWYTHLGWEYDYCKGPLPVGWTKQMAQDQQKMYLLRKAILLHTVKKIFPRLSPEKTNSLAALLYYTHIAGDLLWNNTPEYLVSIADLSKNLQMHLKNLFGDQVDNLCNHIEKDLKNVPFENDADPLDKVLGELFGTIPGLITRL
jgi:hypothetical protein